MNILIFILLSSAKSHQTLGDRIFFGFLSGVFLTIVVKLTGKWKKKREDKKTGKIQLEELQQKQKELAKSILMSNTANSNNNFTLIIYSNLYHELKQKCDPANFVSPYDHKKVEISNSIFSQLEENKYNIDALISLRNTAIVQLGISFSTNELYEKLHHIYNPANYIGDNYDAEKLCVANNIYAQIENNKNNILVLEKIAIEIGLISIQPHDTNVNAIEDGDKNTTKDEDKDLKIYTTGKLFRTIFYIIALLYLIILMILFHLENS